MENETIEQEEQEAIEMIVHYEAECPSLTGRSTLTWQLGRDPRDAENRPLFRIAKNSGKGMHSKQWVQVAEIEALLAKATDVTARVLNELYPGRSINCGGFALAILKDLGVVEPKDDNSRLHKAVAKANILNAIQARIDVAKDAPASGQRRRAKSE
jgi:hypothetical protein